MASATVPNCLPSSSSRCCRGVGSLSSLSSMVAISPIWVCMPVPTTTPRPRPRVTSVPMKAVFSRSPRGMSASSRARAVFSTGRLSPVSAASSMRRLIDSISRTSAGT